jgi:hypothetical protein
MHVAAAVAALGLGCVALAAAARADQCAVNLVNGMADPIVSVTVRAEFAAPGSEADRNLAVALPQPIPKGQSAKIAWECPSSKLSYVATGTFSNGIRRSSAPFSPAARLSGGLDSALLQ